MSRMDWLKIRRILVSVINLAVRLAILVAVFILVKRVCLTAYDYGFRVFSETPVTVGEGMDRTVEIPMGSSALDIGEILQESGLVRDSKLFFIQETLSSYRGDLKPGTYTLNTSMTAEEMMEVMSGREEKEDSEEEGG
ncbi:MAG: endolytic transglycosylase MltG [Lachnospiraceae bacterium]|nr:endolytic transglycosylase MltG [Lachnospiraceae bacterium]